ncbi:MAG: hypothetical protein ACJ746_16030 [Bryobacteraceae bacterium]
MTIRGLTYRLLVVMAVCIAFPQNVFAQADKSTAALSLDDVIKLCAAGMSDEVVITKIKKSGKAFDLSPDEMLELKKSGLTDTVIRYLLDPTLPYTPVQPAPAAPPSGDGEPAGRRAAPPGKKYPKDARAERIPPDPGLYRFVGDTPVPLELRIVLGVKEGSGLGKVLKKGKTIGYLVGAAAKTRVQDPEPIFYMRLPDGKAIEEVVLLQLERNKDRREIELGPPGPKPELKAEAIRPFESLEVGDRLYKISPGKVPKGEYLFYHLGSAEPPKGSYGKGYDFGVDLPAPVGKKPN